MQPTARNNYNSRIAYVYLHIVSIFHKIPWDIKTLYRLHDKRIKSRYIACMCRRVCVSTFEDRHGKILRIGSGLRKSLLSQTASARFH